MMKFTNLDLIASIKASIVGEWFYSHSSKEQKIMLLLFILVSASIMWLIIFKPISNWKYNQESGHAKAFEVMTLLEANKNELVEIEKGDSVDSKKSSIIPIITRTAVLNSIQLNRLQPDGNSVVTVFVENQSFNSVISWISQLQENNGLQVSRINIETQDSNGLISAQITLE